MTNSTAVTKRSPREELRDTLTQFAPSYQKLLPKNYPADRLITGAMVAVSTNPDLLKCKPLTVAIALAKVAQLGLDVGDTAHLVPFGTTCTFIADYKGLIKLMIEAGARKVEAREVREGDEFYYEYGLNPRLQHIPKAKRDAKVIAAYAVVWLRGMVPQFEVMTAEEIDKIRQEKSHSWKKGPLEAWYGRKTVLRRIAKYVPRTPRLTAALAADGFDPETGEVLPAPVLDIPRDDPLAKIEQGDAFEDGEPLGADGLPL